MWFARKCRSDWVSSISFPLVEIRGKGPFLDKRILDFAREIREKKPECKICIITNGTMLNVEKVRTLVPLVDEPVINDYSERYRLADHPEEIYSVIKYAGHALDKNPPCISAGFLVE